MVKPTKKCRKYCAVSRCTNSKINTPEKLFFSFPFDVQMRTKWIEAVTMYAFEDKTQGFAFCCEDHFDLETDVENYIKYKIMGGRVKLKQGTIPHKFECQQRASEPEKRNITNDQSQMLKENLTIQTVDNSGEIETLIIKCEPDSDEDLSAEYKNAFNQQDNEEADPAQEQKITENIYNLETDVENYIKYKIMGGRVKLKKGTIPHQFECQQLASEPDKRNITNDQSQMLKENLTIQTVDNSGEIETLIIKCEPDSDEDLSAEYKNVFNLQDNEEADPAQEQKNTENIYNVHRNNDSETIDCEDNQTTTNKRTVNIQIVKNPIKDKLSGGSSSTENSDDDCNNSSEKLETKKRKAKSNEIVFITENKLSVVKKIDEKCFLCNICNHRFKTAGSLKNHRLIHTKKTKHKCDICGKEFKRPAHLKSHLLVHTNQKTHNCDICNQSFGAECSLKRHMRTHTGERPYICTICDKTYIDKRDLTRHIRTHTGEKPFKCDICTQAFSQACHLKAHILTHSGEKPYTCDVCHKSFRQASNLKVHSRTHTQEKPYNCHLCGQCFSQTSHLKTHLLTHADE